MNEQKELELLRAFFARWEALHAMPTHKDRMSLQYRAKETAAKHLVDAAQAIRDFRSPKPRADVEALRSLQQQTAGIPPKNGFISPRATEFKR